MDGVPKRGLVFIQLHLARSDTEGCSVTHRWLQKVPPGPWKYNIFGRNLCFFRREDVSLYNCLKYGIDIGFNLRLVDLIGFNKILSALYGN